jgi:dTMP kinase
MTTGDDSVKLTINLGYLIWILNNCLNDHCYLKSNVHIAIANIYVKMIPHSTTPPHRGAFVLFEGVDRCGKTTQSKLLLQRLLAAGMAAVSMRFPDRTTATGTIIDSYLKQQSNHLDDHAIHLLFSANRWESASTIANHLRSGTTVVCDRYAYSGVAFSASKVKSDTTVAAKDPVLNLEWCKAPDRGLPAPDCVIFLDLSPGEAEQRGGYVLHSLNCKTVFRRILTILFSQQSYQMQVR